MLLKVYPRFATRQEVAKVSALASSVPQEQWRDDNPNGHVLAWLPEREGVNDKTITTLTNRARKVMAMTPVADGDVILLRYPEGGHLKPHKDEHLWGKHIRIGILIEQATMGGELFVEGALVPLKPGDAVMYRPDEVEHHVRKVVAGERYLLTIGTVFK